MAVLLFSGNVSAQEVLERKETPNQSKSNVEANMFAPTTFHNESLFPQQAKGAGELQNFGLNNQPSAANIGRINTSRDYQWRNATLYGTAYRDVMTGLMEKQDAEVGIKYRMNSFSFNVGLMANVYSFNQLTRLGDSPLRNQFGARGSLHYDFSENLSATVYGQYVSNPFYHSMAAFPYIATSSFGGYITLQNEKMGVDLGVNNYYDPFSHVWRTDPIVRPTYKIGKVKIGMDVGPLVREGILRLAGKRRQAGPIMLP